MSKLNTLSVFDISGLHASEDTMEFQIVVGSGIILIVGCGIIVGSG